MSERGEVPVSVTEQRLRDAFGAAVETVTPASIQSLHKAAGQPAGNWAPGLRRVRPRSWDRPPRPPRFYQQALIPLAAAAAVTLIATTMTVIVPKALSAPPDTHQAVHQGRRGHPSASGGVLATARDVKAGYLGGRVPRGAAPRFFVGIRQPSISQRLAEATELAVYSSATGQVVASLPPPRAGRYYQAVAALGSDRTYVTAASPAQGRDCHTWLYQFTLSSQGQPTHLRPLTVPEVVGRISGNSSLAASADGNMVAYSAYMCASRFNGQVGVISVGTRKVRTWSMLFPADPRNLSLSANGTVLSFVSNPSGGSRSGTPSADAAWVLHTNAASGPLARHYRKALQVSGGVEAATLSPTGVVMFAVTALGRSTAPGAGADLTVVGAYQTATGKSLGLVQFVSRGGNPSALAADHSGGHVLVYPIHLRFVQNVSLATGHLSTVRVGDSDRPLSAAW